MSESIKLLSFESSCDDTSVALLESSSSLKPRLRSFAVQSQDELHEKYGGIVPELASRAHLANLLPCLKKVLGESEADLEAIDVFAATARPGLIGSLLVGHSAAKALAFIYDRPFISVNHLEGHIYSVLLERNLEFPFLSLIVSGGHTSLYRVDSMQSYECIGMTLDDAAGEAFDKAAKLLGLGFPGGAELEKLASGGDPSRYKLSKVKAPGLHFSFSGLKSDFSRLVQREGSNLSASDAAASYQSALLEHLESQVKKALAQTQLARLCIVGGVARNQALRARLARLELEEVIAPSPAFCTDNAAMIGLVAMEKYRRGEIDDLAADVGSTQRPSRARIRREKQA